MSGRVNQLEKLSISANLSEPPILFLQYHQYLGHHAFLGPPALKPTLHSESGSPRPVPSRNFSTDSCTFINTLFSCSINLRACLNAP